MTARVPRQQAGEEATARRILGLDGSTVASGWGIIDERPADSKRRGARAQIELVAYGVLEAKKSARRLDRLVTMAAHLRELLKEYRPTEVAIEEAFLFRNPQTTMALGEVRGVLMLIAREAGLPVYSYPPRIIKQRVASKGSASKEDVAESVRMMLKLEREKRSLDATDALACAICHQAETSGPLSQRSTTLAKGAFRTNRRKKVRPGKIPANWKLARTR